MIEKTWQIGERLSLFMYSGYQKNIYCDGVSIVFICIVFSIYPLLSNPEI